MRHSVTKTEQLTLSNDIILDYDQPLTVKCILERICLLLGENSHIESISNKNVVLYNHNGITECIIVKAITYLGNPHPLYKKRIQLDSSINTFFNENKSKGYNIRLMGAYHYNGLVIYTDFDKKQYLERNLHNSSAHVMINDLYQALEYGSFSKIDYMGNKVTTIRENKFKEYIDENVIQELPLFKLFDKLNDYAEFYNWIYADNAIKTMKENGWYAWRETEWAGFYLEYLINNFIQKEKCSDLMLYKGNIKDKEQLDFDLLFNGGKYYGDIKASDIKYNVCIGNDQTNFIAAINNYEKFWYIVYEHETIKDKEKKNEMAIKRMELIDMPYVEGGHISYKERMKYAVCFKKMYIIELNKINYKNILSDFNQGHQYMSDVSRAPKFKIDKKSIDNYIIYSKNFEKCSQ